MRTLLGPAAAGRVRDLPCLGEHAASVFRGFWVALVGAAVLVGTAGAQSTQQTPPAAAPPATTQTAPAASSSARATAAARQHSLYRQHTIDDRVAQLAKSLDLNEKQQAGLKAVLEHQQLEARQIQHDPSISGEERIGRFRALQDDTVLRIRALLNDEQKKKYNPLNRGKQEEATPSDKYVDQWMKNHQHTDPNTQPAQK